MKNIVAVICLLMLFHSCIYSPWDGGDSIPPALYEPVVMKRTDYEAAIKITDVKTVTNAGKIYVIGDRLFINDEYAGFEIVNNTNPKNPVKEKYLNIPGATDIAIRNNTLYINQATDLVVLAYDASLKQIAIKKRVKNVFPQLLSPNNDYKSIKEDEVIVKWKLK